MDDFYAQPASPPAADAPEVATAEPSRGVAARRSSFTRWEGTATTLGPRVKIVLTVLAILLGYWVSWVPPMFAPLRFITVPGMCVLEWIFLRSMWQRGRR